MEKEQNTGKMDPFTKAISKMDLQMAMEDLYTAMAIITLVNESMIRQMVKELFTMKMEGYMLEVGLMMLNRAMEKKRGLIRPITKGITKMDSSMEKVS